MATVPAFTNLMQSWAISSPTGYVPPWATTANPMANQKPMQQQARQTALKNRIASESYASTGGVPPWATTAKPKF